MNESWILWLIAWGLAAVPVGGLLLVARGIATALAAAGVPPARLVLLGYGWHFLIGATFGVQYTLLVGVGAWVWAVAWSIVIWLAMMVAMPPMMPMIRFPRWFPIVRSSSPGAPRPVDSRHISKL